jgi:hypothetical protein
MVGETTHLFYETKAKNVTYLPTDTGLIHSKCLHSSLHAIKASALPDKVNTEIVVHINGDTLPYTSKGQPSALLICETYLVTNIIKRQHLLLHF